MDYLRSSVSRGGIDALKIRIARFNHTPEAAAAHARQRWGVKSLAAEVLTKAAVAGGVSTSNDWAALLHAADSELHEALAASTILDRLQYRREVERDTAVTTSASAATAEFVSESKPVRISSTAFLRTMLRPKKIVGLIIVSNEIIASGGPKALELLRRDLIRAARIAVDGAFLSADAAGASDAGVGHNITPIASSGTISADVAEMLSVFQGETETAAWITDSSTAAQLAAAGFENVGLRGGELLGLPLLISSSARDSNGGQLMLVDAAMVLATDDGIELELSSEGTLEQDDAPTGASDTPVAATASLVSMFQSDSTAIKLVRRLAWSAAAGAVVITSGIA